MSKNSDKIKELEKFADAIAKDIVSKDLDPKPKSDLILVLYFAIAGMPPSKIPILARSAAEGLRHAIPDARFVIIPTHTENSRLECINPRLASPEEQPQILELIEKVERDFQEFLNSVSLPKEEKDEAPQENRS